MLLVPPLLHFIDEIVYGYRTIDFHLHDTYFVITNTFFFVAVFVFYLFFFCMHFALRTTHKRNRFVCNGHVYGTVVLYLLFFTAYLFHQIKARATPRTYCDLSAWDANNLYSISESVSIMALMLIISFQALFLLYFFVRIFLKPNKVAS